MAKACFYGRHDNLKQKEPALLYSRLVAKTTDHFSI